MINQWIEQALLLVGGGGARYSCNGTAAHIYAVAHYSQIYAPATFGHLPSSKSQNDC